MFSGIIEAASRPLEVQASKHLIRLTLKKPASFKSLREGESISVDGACLTLESFNSKKMVFAMGPETLKATGWTARKLRGKLMNLERSLTLQKAVGGHLITGHVDGLALVTSLKKRGESLIAKIKIPEDFSLFFWKKAYIALNGVSLTVNQAKDPFLEVCLIPKTLELTNLRELKEGVRLNFEADYMARPMIAAFQKTAFASAVF